MFSGMAEVGYDRGEEAIGQMKEEAEYKVIQEEKKGEEDKGAGEVSEEMREGNKGIHSEAVMEGKRGEPTCG